MTPLFIFFFLRFRVLRTTDRSDIIGNPLHVDPDYAGMTNMGCCWRNSYYCPSGWATGFDTNYKVDYGIVSIRLECSDGNHTYTGSVAAVNATEMANYTAAGRTWSGSLDCISSSGFLVGFSHMGNIPCCTNTDRYHTYGPALAGLKMFCSDKQVLQSQDSVPLTYSWKAFQTCPVSTAICGLDVDYDQFNANRPAGDGNKGIMDIKVQDLELQSKELFLSKHYLQFV